MFKWRLFRLVHYPVFITLFLLSCIFILNLTFNKPVPKSVNIPTAREIVGDIGVNRKDVQANKLNFRSDGTKNEVFLFFNNMKKPYRTEISPRGVNNEIKGKVLFPGKRIVHLDLKGAPPKISYLVKIFPFLASLGADGLLVEYEDMFPYYSARSIAARNAYTRKEINELLNAAKRNKLDVIPLIQTFGHAEYVLKLREYKHLREVPAYPQVYCPSKNETLRLIESLIDDVLSAHPDVKYFHIGCDEVYHLAKCDQCRQAMETNNWTKNDLFKNHVRTVAEYVKTHYPSVQVLVWDDEFRSWSIAELKDSGLGDLVLPVVWNYNSEVSEHFSPSLWTTYSTVFKKVWIASAFKGASASDATALDLDIYTANHESWINTVDFNSKYIEFAGIILTGWQRYDHFSILCELFPVGFPSLAVNLAYLSGSENSMEKVKLNVKDHLSCDSPLSFKTDNGMTNHCDFPGAGIYEAVSLLSSVVEDIQRKKSTSAFRGWFSKYNRDKHFASPSFVESAGEGLNEISNELTSLELKLSEAMDTVYDKFTIEEWLSTHLRPHQNEIKALLRAQVDLLQRDEWPRRPLPDYKN